MRTVIAGGRYYRLTWVDFLYLQTLPITEVVSGGAKGADTGGEEFAQWVGLPVRKFPADWNRYGRSAGMRRNLEMAEYAEAVVLFPGGTGTANMRRQAIKNRLLVFENN